MNGENTRGKPYNPTSQRIYLTAAVLLVTILVFYGLVKAQGFLAPLVTAIILSLVVLPLARKMERGMSRLWASLLNAFLLFLFALGCIFLVVYQFESLTDDWGKIKERMQPKLEQSRDFLAKKTPLTKSDLHFMDGKNSGITASKATSAANKALSVLSRITGFLGTFLLVFVYIFFLLFYRRRFRVFLLRIFPEEKKEEVASVMARTARVVPKYLAGKLILMGIIAVVYAVGLGISGVNNFIVVSLISALLALIPYIGNIIAYVLAMAFGFLTSGDTAVLLGVTLTFGLGQFFQTYFLEPYLLGDQVDVHPFFVILAVIIGNLVWGVIGMVLAIPLLGIVTILFIHTRELHELGLLLSKEKI